MSTSPDADFSLELHFLPAWAQEAPDTNRYAKFAGEPERRDDRRGDRGDRGPRRFDRPAGRGPGGPGGSGRPGGPGRAGGQGGPGRPPQGDRNRGPQRGGDDRRGRDDQRGGRDQVRREPLEAPLVEINLAFTPDDNGVDSLAKQIRKTGRAYPLFDIAQMILQKPERHSITLSVKKNAEGVVVQPLFVCAIDDTPWLSEEEAVGYVLDKHFGMFYQAERTQIDPPKGTYTFVAQCGMSGVVLGPPNYHDYQNQLRKLHGERFGRMPFDMFKARVKIVRDEAVVKKWLEDQSFKTEFVCLNLPEPLRLGSREEVEKHFRETHLPNIIKQVETHHLTGAAARNLRSRELVRLLRIRWEDQKRFPLQIATVLSQQFATRGLQFFKVNKSVTHVAVARPHFLDLDATPVSEGVKRIVNFINTTPKCSHIQLLKSLAPGLVPPAPVEGAEPVVSPEPTPEMTAVMTDLHWLVHQGHVIEFANGLLEMAKKPLPRPEKPKPAVVPAAVVTDVASAAGDEPIALETSTPSDASAPVESVAETKDALAPTPVELAEVEQPPQPS